MEDPVSRRRIGYFLVILSLLLGLLAIGKDQFIDEHAIIASGKLITKGYSLYSEIFSHHFPLPYYWAAFMFSLVGNSLIAIRIGLLIFQTFLFVMTIKYTDYGLEVGITAVLWAIFRSFYNGNMVVYPSFSAVFLVCLLFFALDYLKHHPERVMVFLIGSSILSIFAIFSDPLTVYPIAAICIFIFFRNHITGMKLGSLIVAGISITLLLLFINGSLSAFWDQAIKFNSEIYSAYKYATPFRFLDWISQTVKLLGITDPIWTSNINPKGNIEVGAATFDHWLFTGFLTRYIILSTTIMLLIKKEWLSAGLLYFFSSALLVVNEPGFRTQPVFLVGLAGFSLILVRLPQLISQIKIVRYIQIANVIIITLMMAWVSLRCAKYNLVWSEKFTKEASNTYDPYIEVIENLKCANDGSVYMAAYPGSTYIYWVSDFLPVKGYLYMWPWVADYNLEGVIEEMSDPDYRAYAIIHKECSIWDHFECKDFLGPLIDYLEKNYISINDTLYISPAQFKTCQNTPN